jgi:hypothetical protein
MIWLSLLLVKVCLGLGGKTKKTRRSLQERHVLVTPESISTRDYMGSGDGVKDG